jgi:hypothetical protein
MMKVRDEAFKFYFYFMQERMKLFWNRYDQKSTYMVDDDVLNRHRFTNVYRATDRVSQYLIKNVIYSGEQSLDPESLLLNILVFKVFNRISTWETIKKEFGNLDVRSFKPKKLSSILDVKIEKEPIFNPAYIMTASSDKYRYLARKHERWLEMIDKEIIKPRLFAKILEAKSLEEIYLLLHSCTFIGPFLSYQYAIDFNYSPVINFNENSFVKAGIGAQRGIRKCFEDLGSHTYEDAIKFTQENLDLYREKFNYTFKNLFDHAPTLIDLQNCFCETDKILRVKMPQISEGNSRIKQVYREDQDNLEFFFPPKWNIQLL